MKGWLDRWICAELLDDRREGARGAARRSGSAAAPRPAACRPASEAVIEGAGAGRRSRPAWATASQVVGVGCMRLCCEGPLVQVDPDGALYEKVTPDDAAVDRRRPRRRDGARPSAATRTSPFFARQMSDRAGEQRP